MRYRHSGQVTQRAAGKERFCSKFASIFPFIFKGVDKRKQVAKSSGIDLMGTDELERHLPAIASSGEAGGD